MAFSSTLNAGERAQRKALITVAEWTGASHDVYTLVTSEPISFDPTEYYKKQADGTYVAGTASDEWAANTWYSKSTSTTYRQVLGARTEDSSIEYNADIATSTDILGITYTDVNKTEPQQTFDPFNVMGGSDLADYLSQAALGNEITKFNGVFTLYVITAYLKDSSNYFAVKHTGCSIIPTSLGGDSYVNMPIEAHYSNNITKGSVNKLGDDFTFTPAGS